MVGKGLVFIMGRPSPNLNGKKFNHLTIIKDTGSREGDMWVLCKCDCGNECEKPKSKVTSGVQKACGCTTFIQEKYAHRGELVSKHPLYHRWNCIKDRCYNERSKDYAGYGGRGIKMCERWRKSFFNFRADMGEPPTVKHSIERIRNNGHYSPKNCKWGIPLEQQNNKRNNVRITYKGKTQNLSQWARELEFPASRAGKRLKAGMPIKLAFSTEVLRRTCDKEMNEFRRKR